jgi:hypothetical protein
MDSNLSIINNRVLRLYKLSRSVLLRLYVLAKVGLHGFWLGILTNKQLHIIDEVFYSDTAMYFTDEYTKRGLFGWEKEALGQHFSECRSILLLAAGGGREIFGLQEFGFDVHAFECHPGLRDYANDFLSRESLIERVLPINRDECPPSNTLLDGAILGWGSYMLIPSRQIRISFLKQLRQNLTPGSPVLLSFYARAGNEKRFWALSKTANIFRRITFRELTTEGDDLVPHYAHYFSKVDLKEELNDSGFDLITFESSPYGHGVGIRR